MSNLGTALALIGAGAGGWVQGQQRAQQYQIDQQRAQDLHDEAQAEIEARQAEAQQRKLDLARQRQINDLTGTIAQKASGNYATPDQAAQAGMSQDSASVLMSPQGGYGGGAQGLQTAVGDYDRESQRFANAPDADPTAAAGAAGLPAPRAPNVDTSQTYNYTPRSRFADIYQLAALRGDQAGMMQAQAGMRQEDFRANVGKALQDWNSMTPMQQSQWAHDTVFANGGGNVLVSNTNPKTGMTEVSLTNANGDIVRRLNLQPSEMAQLYVAHNLDPQFSDEAMKMMSDNSKNLRDIIDHFNSTTAEVAKTNNDATYKAGAVAAEKEGADARMLEAGAMRDRVAAMERDGRMGAVQYFKMPDGSVQGFVPSMAKGKLGWQQVDLPQGGVPFRQPAQAGVKVDANGTIVKGDDVYVPDPKDATKYKKVNLGPSALDMALASDKGGQGGPGAAPGAGAGLPPAPVGRPLIYATPEQLQSMALRPRGVSPSDAMEAQLELDRRRQEGSITAR
jgi:hypothetical protein